MAQDDGIEALVLSVNQSVHSLELQLEETQDALSQMNDRLKGFLPRREANDKAHVIRKWFAGVIIAGMVVAASALTGWLVNYSLATQSLKNCETTRMGFREVIEKAVSDPAEREVLLAVDGTKPELCR